MPCYDTIDCPLFPFFRRLMPPSAAPVSSHCVPRPPLLFDRCASTAPVYSRSTSVSPPFLTCPIRCRCPSPGLLYWSLPRPLPHTKSFAPRLFRDPTRPRPANRHHTRTCAHQTPIQSSPFARTRTSCSVPAHVPARLPLLPVSFQQLISFQPADRKSVV